MINALLKKKNPKKNQIILVIRSFIQQSLQKFLLLSSSDKGDIPEEDYSLTKFPLFNLFQCVIAYHLWLYLTVIFIFSY